MNKRLALVSILLVTATTVFAAEGAFTWAHFLLGWLEQPLVELGIDPVPMLDLLIVAILLIAFAFLQENHIEIQIWLSLPDVQIFQILQKLLSVGY